MSLRSLSLALLRCALAALVVASITGFSCQTKEHLTGNGQWRFWGGNLHNTHEAEAEKTLSPANVSRLAVRWKYETTGDVSAIPTVQDGVVYVPDWGPFVSNALPVVGGRMHAIDAGSGKALWTRDVTSYGASRLNNRSRSSPAIDGNVIVFGSVISQPLTVLDVKGEGAVVYAVNRNTGDLLWKTNIDPHPFAHVTQSPVIYDGKVFVGVASLEEGAAKLAWPCCSFRGSMVSLDLASGRILWKTYMTPDNGGKPGGFSGAAVWGSSPAIDSDRGVVYVATGNNYAFPQPLNDCLNAHHGDPKAQDSECYAKLDPPDNYADSVVALDLADGHVHWAKKIHNYGAWTFACDPKIVPWLPVNPANCKDLDSLDYDFGSAPMLYTAKVNGKPRDLLGIGQKSGVVYALDPDHAGDVVWATTVGPGGANGGIEFGGATDGQRIYVQITNFEHNPFTLTAGAHKGETANGGIWAAVDAATGELLWQTPDPSSTRPQKGIIAHPVWGPFLGPGYFGVAMGPMTVANGVVYAGSMDQEGHMYAFDAATGAILWTFASGGSVMSAPSIVDGVLYWGCGYTMGFNAHTLYAFALPD